MRNDNLVAACKCGRVAVLLTGSPIMTVACYCNSCRQAASELGRLPNAAPICEPDGGTHFVMQRKDRLSCVQGQENLHEHRLAPGAKTRRMIATCCNSAMFLEFEAGHWLSVYARRIDPSERPPIEQRTMLGDLPNMPNFNDGIPSPRQHTVAFMWKLLFAWAVMGFRSPRVEFVNGPIDA